MPLTPYIPSLSMHSAEAMVNSPDTPSNLLPRPRVYLEPLQPIRDIRATGFDAIIQMTDNVMRMVLSRGLGSRRTVDSPIPTNLDQLLIEAVSDRVAAERIEAPVIAWPLRPEQVEVDLEPTGLRASMSLSGVHVSQGLAPKASVRFSVTLAVTAAETAASHAARVHFSSFRSAPPPFRDQIPAGSEPLTAELEIATMLVVVSGPVRTYVDTNRFRIDAVLDFSSADVNSDSNSQWDSPILELVQPLIRGWGQAALIPTISLFGDPPSIPVPEATRFDVTVVGLPSNRLGTLLAFCIETAAGTSAPDPERVGAFTGGRNFAFFTTDPVIRGIVLSRWHSLPHRRLEWIVPITIQRDDTYKQGSARVRYEVGEARWAAMSYGTEHISDNIMVYADFSSQTLSARFEGRDITSELGELATPHESRELFRIFADNSPVGQVVEALDEWLVSIGRYVIAPLLRPVSSSWDLSGDYETHVSTPNSAMVTRGDLT